MGKSSKFIIAGVVGFLLFFLVIIGALLGYELALVGDETEFMGNMLNTSVKHKYYFYEVKDLTNKDEEEPEGKWLEVDGIPIEIDTVQDNTVPPQKYSRLEFELNSDFANNSDYLLVDLGFYIWIDLQEGEERSLSFSLEYGGKTSETSVDIVYDADTQKGRGVVKFMGLDTNMRSITNFVIKLDCLELNNDNCIEWTFTDMKISYNIEK